MLDKKTQTLLKTEQKEFTEEVLEYLNKRYSLKVMNGCDISFKRMAPGRLFIDIVYNKGQYNFTYEMGITTTDPKDKRSLPYKWFKNGYTKKVVNNYITLNGYLITDSVGVGGDFINPTIKKGGAGYVIDFNNLLRPTLANIVHLIDLTSHMIQNCANSGVLDRTIARLERGIK